MPQTQSKHTPELMELAEAVQETISENGEPNNYTSDYTLADLRRLADAALAKAAGDE